jgi:hypothetical protein
MNAFTKYVADNPRTILQSTSEYRNPKSRPFDEPETF